MMDQQTVDALLRKARESLESAESEFANRRYNSCADRCYYACFQDAVVVLVAAGVEPRGQRGHDYVQAAFAGLLVNRRKHYPSRYGSTLPDLLDLRQTADYKPRLVTQEQASRALRHGRELVHTVRSQGESTAFAPVRATLLHSSRSFGGITERSAIIRG